MKKLFLLLLVVGAIIPAKATTLSGSLKNPDGTGASGRLQITLSQQAIQLSTGGCGGPAVIVPTALVTITVSAGAMSGSPTLVGNDCLSPSNTYYIVTMRDGNGNILFKENWQVTGASIDVGTILPIIVPQGTTSISQAYITNLALSGTLNGNPTLSGNFAGNPTFIGNPIFSGTPVFNNLFNVAGSQVATIASTKVFTNTTFDTAGTGNVFKVNSTQISDKTGTGKVVLDTSPTIASPTTTGTDNGAETLTNKVLATSSNNVTLIDNQSGVGPLVGNSSAKTVYTTTLPVIPAGKGVNVCVYAIHTTGSGVVAYAITLGSTNIHAWSDSTAGGVNNLCTRILNSPGSQAVQRSRTYMFVAGSAVSGTGVASAVENLANATVLKFTFNAANTEQVTGSGWAVEMIQ